MPKFSIIVPVYKVEAYLDDCIQSILQQKYTDYEVILVDDGSPDDCAGICDKYAQNDNRIKVIHQENSGVTEARKSGVSMATGEYIVCVDGDDWIDPSYLAEFATEIKKNDSDIVCCSYYHVKDNSIAPIKLDLVPGYYDREKIENELFSYLIEDSKGRSFPPMLWGKAIRSSLFRENQMEKHAKIGEDQACIKPCVYNAGSLSYIAKNLYYYRINNLSATKGKKVFPWGDPKTIGQVFSEKIDLTRCDFQEQVYRFVVHNLFIVACSQFNKQMAYAQVKEKILANISESFYQTAIDNCRYGRNIKGKLALFSLKRKCVFLMCLYNRMM